MRLSEKTTENSEWLGRQARQEFEPGTSRLPVLSITAVLLMGPNLVCILYITVLPIVSNLVNLE